MKNTRRFTATAAATLGLGAAILTVTGQPAMAVPTCNRTMVHYFNRYPANIPSTGNTTASTSCVMGLNAQSAAVRALQFTLNTCYGADLGNPDGIYGTRTRTAVRNAQRSEGLPGDGVYGPVTRDKLRWALNSDGFCSPRWDFPGGA